MSWRVVCERTGRGESVGYGECVGPVLTVVLLGGVTANHVPSGSV